MESKRTETKGAKPVELRPDGWERFEQAVDIAAKTPAKHRTEQTNPRRSIVKQERKA